MFTKARRMRWVDLGLVVGLSLGLSLIVFWPRLHYFDVPWGSSDMTQYYFVSQLWSGWRFGFSDAVGFPDGLNANVYAGLDGIQSTLARVLNVLSGSPFVGLNLLLFLSFPIVAGLAYAAIRLVGLCGPVAIALAVSFTFIPYHLSRGLNHLHLALLWGLMTGVLLALIIGSGRMEVWLQDEDRRKRIWTWAFILSLVVLSAWSGLYYAVFTVILCSAALVWRVAHGASGRALWREGLSAVLVGVLAIAGLLPVLASRRAAAALGAEAVGLRDPMDSVTYAGNLAAAIIPQPISAWAQRYNDAVVSLFASAPQTEGNVAGNFGSWVTLICLGIWGIGMLTQFRRRELDQGIVAPIGTGATRRPSLTLLAFFLFVVVMFFVPWGLNFLSASLLTAQIRAWNRLVPLLLLLAILGAAAVMRQWRWSKSATVLATLVILAVTAVEMVLPWRGIYSFTVDMGQKRMQEMSLYLAQIEQREPERCGIFTYPVTDYPNHGPSGPLMDDYDHLYLVLGGPGKPISYGANRGSTSSAWQSALAGGLSRQSVDDLRRRGFCIVHLDTGGFAEVAPIRDNLRSNLGPALVTSSSGRFEAYRLP